MRILTKGELVDFETPIFMTAEQKEEFLKEMQSIFRDRLSIEPLHEIRKSRKGVVNIKYSKEDMLILMNSNLSEEDKAKKLGKTSRAIHKKMGRTYKDLFMSYKNQEKIDDQKEAKEFSEEKYGEG